MIPDPSRVETPPLSGMSDSHDAAPTVEQIQERLAKITPGPWHRSDEYLEDFDSHAIFAPRWRTDSAEGSAYVAQCDMEWRGPETKANADFIANAPASIAFLLAALARVTEERDALRDENRRFVDWLWCETGREEIEEASKDLRRWRDASRMFPAVAACPHGFGDDVVCVKCAGITIPDDGVRE